MRRFGNDGEVQEHVKFIFGYPLFLAVSPFIIMIVSTLVTILISIFNKNLPATLSADDVTGLKTYLLNDLKDLQNINFVKIDVGGQQISIVQALNNMQTELTNAITQANANGRSDIANQLQTQLNDVNNILNYINSGNMTEDIQTLTLIINQLQTGTLDLSGKLANQIANVSLHLNNINLLFNGCLSDYKDLSKFHDTIISWDTQFSSIFLTFDGLKDSSLNMSSDAYLGYFISDQKGLVDRILYGDTQQIGLQALQLKTMGMISMNLVEQIYTFITGDPNGNN
jgi:hypothetical protein